jgi:preprotein translocase subunit SecE
MSTSKIETVNGTLDRIKLALAVLILAAGIVAFSMLSAQPIVLRVGVFLASLIIAAGVAWFSEPGRRAIGYLRDSYHEARRVHWPTRKEAMQMTGIVFVFVIIMAIFLWLVDKLLGWVIYGLLLGWR